MSIASSRSASGTEPSTATGPIAGERGEMCTPAEVLRAEVLRAEMFRALGTLCEAPHGEHVAIAHALGLPQWPTAESGLTGVFVLELLPYAAIYLGPEGMLGGDAAVHIAGLWRALGHQAPAEPDHLAALLGLYAVLLEAESQTSDPPRRLLVRHARHTILADQLLSWLPAYATAVAQAGPASHTAWARLLIAGLVAEAAELDGRSDPPVIGQEALQPPSAVQGSADFLAALLTPSRSGLIITRADIAACARRLQLGLRMGERAFVLRWVMDQDPIGALTWAGEQAEWWCEQHRAQASAFGLVAERWAQRAAATRTALRQRIQLVGEARP